jgi:hypothetical protein
MSYIRDKLLKPRTWGRSTSCAIVWSMVIGATIGAVSQWWFGRPWIEFHGISATYIPGGDRIFVTGEYDARKTCSREEENTPLSAPDPLVWRQEVSGTGSEIISYAPVPDAPDLDIGTHRFWQEIPLVKGINPDGWSVAITVSCSNEPVAIRSRSSIVQFIDPVFPQGGKL